MEQINAIVDWYRIENLLMRRYPVGKSNEDNEAWPFNVELIFPSDNYRVIKLDMKAEVIPEKPIGGQHIAVVTIVDRVIDYRGWE